MTDATVVQYMIPAMVVTTVGAMSAHYCNVLQLTLRHRRQLLRMFKAMRDIPTLTDLNCRSHRKAAHLHQRHSPDNGQT
jgi:hypothetical protein